MPTAAGHDSRLSYVWEGVDNFATDSPSDSDDKPFGSDPTLTSKEGSHNAVRLFDPNSRQAREIIEQMFDGSWGVEFNLSNPWWLGGVIGEGTTSTDNPITYDSGPPKPLQIWAGNEITGDSAVLMGCVINSADISVSTDGMVEVSLDGAYAEERIETNLKSQPAVEYRPMAFHQANVYRGGTVLNLTQSVSVSLENNIDIIGELGTRFGVDYSPKKLTADVDYTRVVNTEEDTKRMYGGGSTVASEITNTEDIRLELASPDATLDLSMSGAFPNSSSRSGTGDPEADLEDDLTEFGAQLSATADYGGATVR